ncbi:MAG: 2-C-methyl-D-erythritol 2,4-cyclodiphosphate synthase [Actinomycetota bacterium]|nr:2-C-methyl-D-erythritol 2,4-cyclodiphosphate synthase [Actinomycetota bacterium]MDA3003593.1 2-C-methyl-D-erythritol 2,4-cyclodiphosphate synthase [Actinomycetota bacterium]
MTMQVRVGQGFDIHRFTDNASDDRKLILGGVHFKGERGLIGHSDADVVAHATAEAILGACGLGNIGEHFPDTDAKYKNVDSIKLLELVSKMAQENNFEIGNVDCSIVCEQPKIAPHRDAMQQKLSLAVGAPVTVKGRRAEGLGALGRAEGIACWAVAVVTKTK